MAKNLDQLQQKLFQNLQSKFESFSNHQKQFEQCFTQNQSNISKYVNCVKPYIPKYKSAEESFGVGMQFLEKKVSSCLQGNKNPNDCLQQALRIGDDIMRVLQNDLK